MGVPKGAVCINVRFLYTIKHKPPKAGHVKSESYIDNERRLDARFLLKVYQVDNGANDSTPTSQLRSLRAFLAAISYRKWNFRAMDVIERF